MAPPLPLPNIINSGTLTTSGMLQYKYRCGKLYGKNESKPSNNFNQSDFTKRNFGAAVAQGIRTTVMIGRQSSSFQSIYVYFTHSSDKGQNKF